MATTSLGVDCGPAQQGFQSVVFCDGKMGQEIVRLARALLRLDRRAVYHESARAVTVHDPTRMLKGDVLIVTAGTADIPVAEKARVTAEVMGSRVETIYDVGVAGLHRVLARLSRLLQARVVVVVAAGMDGVLPSVVGGLIDCPVIAVPTSIGYGANFGGVAPLLTMLNSCASGMGVVNINNGFGAGCLAHRINIMAGKYGISVPASVSSNGAFSRLNRKDTRPSNKGGPHGEPIRETQAVHSDRR